MSYEDSDQLGRERSGGQPATKPRQGWDEQFQAMAKRGDDGLLMSGLTTEWDDAEWEW